MPLQTQDLLMTTLAVQKDRPPNDIQPSLKDGIHLRWAFKRDRGFPWHGYYLFRRNYRHGILVPARFSSVVDLDIHGQPYRQYDLEEPAYRVQIQFDFHAAGRITAAALMWGTQVDEHAITCDPGDTRTINFAYDTITSIRFSLGPAVPSGIRSVSVSAEAGLGWELVPGFPAPMSLPVNRSEYPCTAGIDEDLNSSRIMAAGRIRYGDPSKLTALPASSYTRGTVTVSNGSFVVAGHGTKWRDAWVGTVFQVDGDPTAYTIMKVIDAEKLVLSRAYVGPSRANADYMIHHDHFGQLHDHLVQLVSGGPATGPPMAYRSLPQTIYAAGTVELTNGSPVAHGVGTAWSEALVGLDLQAVGADTGTVHVEHGSPIVTGTGTFWHSNVLGMSFQILGDASSYMIASHQTHFRIVLDRPFTGISADTMPYKIFERAAFPIAEIVSPAELRLERPYYGPERSTPVGYAIISTLQSPGRGQTPWMPRQSPLDLVLLGSLHPAMAQMVGLYWVDSEAGQDQAYDYLIMADHDGFFHCDPQRAKVMVGSGEIEAFPGVDGYIVFNKMRVPSTPLSPPDDLRAYALPAGARNPAAPNSAGLTWDTGATGGVLLPDKAVMVHLWRADLGEEEPSDPPADDRYRPVSCDKSGEHPILVSALPPGLSPERPDDWPPFPLMAIDRELADGWYSYRVSGIDIFGRHSRQSHAARWHQWSPIPDPKPWYYRNPPGHREIHSYAVRLLDKLPPPPPAGIEAYALDPADPTVMRDAAYQAWRDALNPEDRDTLVGLRVRWLWTVAHMAQAPDTREFRIYYQPGRLNAVLGRIVHVSPRVSPDEDDQTDVTTDIPNDLPINVYRGMRLQEGAHFFKVLSSESGSPLRLRVQNVGSTKEIRPCENSPCSLALSSEHPEHVDYSSSLGWMRRIHVIGYDEHVHERIPAMRDTNGYPMMGRTATVTGSTVSLQNVEDADLSEIDSEKVVLYLETDRASADKRYRILSVNNADKTVKVAGTPDIGADPSLWVIGPPVPLRHYEVFLPAPDTAEGGGFAPSLADPIVYAHIGVSAADGRPHTVDDPRWAEEAHGGWEPDERYGNEGRVGPPVSIFRVRRERPEAPTPPPDSEKVYATPADYHGHSYYTYRWQPVEHLNAHIFRAVDDAIFKRDWAIRTTRSALNPSLPRHESYFENWYKSHHPTPWDLSRKRDAANELNGIDSQESYDRLSVDARNLLALLPGNEGQAWNKGLQERDWAIRTTRGSLTAAHTAYFPQEWLEPDNEANRLRREHVADELNAIVALLTGEAATINGDDGRVVALDGNPDLRQVRPNRDLLWLATAEEKRKNRPYRITVVNQDAYVVTLDSPPTLTAPTSGWAIYLDAYRELSNDALRALAGLPGNERVFTQITIQPLDPNDPANANQRKPGDPDEFEVWDPSNPPPDPDNPLEDPGLRIYLDTLPGRSTNRYFYRAAYVDGAQNRSHLSLASPPVYLPKVTPPRTPVITKVLGGDRRITLRWKCSREPDLSEYRLFRTDKKEKSRDIKLMTLVNTQSAPPGDPMGRPTNMYCDDEVPSSMTFYYRSIAVDRTGNVSKPSKIVTGRAFDHSTPTTPIWERVYWRKIDEAGVEYAWDDAPETARPVIALEWSCDDSQCSYLIQKREISTAYWRSISRWLAGANRYLDNDVVQNRDYEYQIKVKNRIGNMEISSIQPIYRVA